MTVVWCVLKFFHELGHGLACKRFGSHVREAGLMFILFAPIPYVDVTSAWKIPSKWKRIFHFICGYLYRAVLRGDRRHQFGFTPSRER